MEQIPPPKEVKILETAEDIQERREQVLNRYEDFKQEARAKREKLEDSWRFQYFKRDADELESWIQEKFQAANDESYKDPTNLQAKIQNHQAFEAEVAARSNAIVVLDNTDSEMIDTIRKRLDELHRLWELLLSRLAEKGMKLQQALLVQFLRHCDEVMFWVDDKGLNEAWQRLRQLALMRQDRLFHSWRVEGNKKRKYEGVERDLAALEDEVATLEVDGEVARLADIRRDEITTAWQTLVHKAQERRLSLVSSYALHRFLVDYRDFVSWMNDICAFIDLDKEHKAAPAQECCARAGHGQEEVGRRHVL